MDLTMEPRPVLAVSLNSAWQKTLNFGNVAWGEVNRAESCHEAGGGKGVNVARVFRLLKRPVAVLAFAGGDTGQNLRREFKESGVEDLTVTTAGRTRCCYTVIDKERGHATELIEPSSTVSGEEFSELMSLVSERISHYGAVALCGSLPSGVPSDTYGRIAAVANGKNVPVVVDVAKNVSEALESGAVLLKINGEELSNMTGASDMIVGAESLLGRYPKLDWLAVTNGGEPAMLFRRGGCWRITLPRFDKIVSPIGGGDCTTAIMTRRIAEGWRDDIKMVEAFAEALSCASASCLTDTPSVFEIEVAEKIRSECRIEQVR